MDSKEWLQKEKELYYKVHDQVRELFKLTGNTVLKITFTYIAIYNFDKKQTEYFFVFLPYKTRMEKQWEASKDFEASRPWYQSYSFNLYSNDLPYIYIKDDCISTTPEFYKSIFDTKLDIKIYKYDNFLIQEPELTIIGDKPVLHFIESGDSRIKEDTFEEWYKNQNSVCDITLKFTNPLRLFWNNKNIVLTTKNSGHTFFKVFLE